MQVNRTEVNRALAKAIAYKQCGQQAKATQWAAELVRLLECAEILAPYAWTLAPDSITVTVKE